jgi:hypothetical protein
LYAVPVARRRSRATVAQIERRLGFTVREWKLMEADECMVPDPDAFWERAMVLVDKVETGG